MQGWNGELGAGSAAAALYEIWARHHLPASAVKAVVPEGAQATFGPASLIGVVQALEEGALPGADTAALRSAILLGSLGSAWAEAARLLGPDPARWRWGTLHVADFRAALPIAGFEAARRVGPLPIGGGSSTPNAASWGDNFALVSGPSVRIVMDVGVWDNSVAINTPGQSGDPASPHYRDLFARWAGGAYVPFAWSRARVLQEAERIIAVTPVP